MLTVENRRNRILVYLLAIVITNRARQKFVDRGLVPKFLSTVISLIEILERRVKPNIKSAVFKRTSVAGRESVLLLRNHANFRYRG